jgi:hypothetical protein
MSLVFEFHYVEVVYTVLFLRLRNFDQSGIYQERAVSKMYTSSSPYHGVVKKTEGLFRMIVFKEASVVCYWNAVGGTVCYVLGVACFIALGFTPHFHCYRRLHTVLSYVSGMKFGIGVNGFIFMVLIPLCFIYSIQHCYIFRSIWPSPGISLSFKFRILIPEGGRLDRNM